jgi:hypothetical protein
MIVFVSMKGGRPEWVFHLNDSKARNFIDRQHGSRDVPQQVSNAAAISQLSQLTIWQYGDHVETRSQQNERQQTQKHA